MCVREKKRLQLLLFILSDCELKLLASLNFHCVHMQSSILCIIRYAKALFFSFVCHLYILSGVKQKENPIIIVVKKSSFEAL